MKKIIAILILNMLAIPVYSACSIENGLCTGGASVLGLPTIKDKYIPDNLQNLQKPDAFIPKYHKPYYDMLINTESNDSTGAAAPNYNSNCQFGVCLPEATPEEAP